MIDDKHLAIELYLLPNNRRRRLLSAIPDKFRERLQRYFEYFDSSGRSDGRGDASSLPDLNGAYARTAKFAELLPGASAGFIDRFGRLLDGEHDAFPPEMALALRDFGAAQLKTTGEDGEP